MLTVKRSPAKVCWWVTLGQTVLLTTDTRFEAQEVADKLNKKYESGIHALALL